MTAPTHAGRLAFVPVWAWTGDDPVVMPRWGLPDSLVDVAAWLQVAACEALEIEPTFRLDLYPTGPWEARLWRFERWVGGGR
ncbi:MAG: hypothetical protein Q8P41_31785 [Pseudomonadota bacterium]|nr:hypothetical protein [Pseudomonadota bacterium]